MSNLPADPNALKKLEKQLAKETKSEGSQVSHIQKDLASLEKHVKKSEKYAGKAEKNLEKKEQKEVTAAKAVNRATHAHDVAVTDINSAEKELKIKQQNDAKLKQDLERKKAQVESAIASQAAHDRERDAKAAEIQALKDKLANPAPDTTSAVPAHSPNGATTAEAITASNADATAGHANATRAV